MGMVGTVCAGGRGREGETIFYKACDRANTSPFPSAQLLFNTRSCSDGTSYLSIIVPVAASINGICKTSLWRPGIWKMTTKCLSTRRFIFHGGSPKSQILLFHSGKFFSLGFSNPQMNREEKKWGELIPVCNRSTISVDLKWGPSEIVITERLKLVSK